MFSLFEWVAIITASILLTFIVVGSVCWACIKNTPLPDMSYNEKLRERVNNLELSRNILEEKLQQTINATTMIVYDMTEKITKVVHLENKSKTKIPKTIKRFDSSLPEISGDLNTNFGDIK